MIISSEVRLATGLGQHAEYELPYYRCPRVGTEIPHSPDMCCWPAALKDWQDAVKDWECKPLSIIRHWETP